MATAWCTTISCALKQPNIASPAPLITKGQIHSRKAARNCDWLCRAHCCSAWRPFMLPCPAALLLCLCPIYVVGRCIDSSTSPSYDAVYSSSPSFAAPQDFPLRDNVPVNQGANPYPFKWDPVTISIIGIVLMVNAAFVACCLRTICLRIFWPDSQQSAPPAAPAAADVPQAAVARDGAGPDASNGAAHVSMTAVIQPNDEVGVAMLIPPEGVQAPIPGHPSRSDGIEDPPQAPADAATSGCVPGTCFKNPLLLTHGYPARRLQYTVAQH